MTAGPGKGALEARDSSSQYSGNGAGGISVERLAAVLGGRYTIQREIGHGGAAVVYLAHDLREDRLVAIKVLRADLAAAVGEARFLREIEIARRLHHDNILPLLESGSVEGIVYFTMPYIEGDTLRSRIRKERQLPLSDALSITRDVGTALDYAHANGVLHRDIKPANILLADGHAVVADFGIARAMTVAAGEEITTHSGLAIGTPEYMSPEQGVGQRDLDSRCDIYALGCVLYEMLVGEPPFTGPTAQAVIARHCQELPHSIRVIRATIPPGVERAIRKALAKVPADRYATAGQFIADLDAGVESAEDSALFAGPSPRTWIFLATAAVAIAGTATWYATRPSAPLLDPNRVVVFPLHDQAASTTPDGGGEGVATFIGYALDGTRPLKWLDGWELLDSTQRAGSTRLDSRKARSLSARAGAGFYVDGSVMRRPDSVTVILRLFNVAKDSLIRVAGRSGPAGSAPLAQLGVSAMSELLPVLVSPGGKIDLSAFRDRKPKAVANFLQGEREYRRMQFHSALDHYQSALREDTSFTLAAIRGAYAANWLSALAVGAGLADTALRHTQSLAPGQALLARGLHAYLTGSADSALRYLHLAIRNDSSLHAGFTLLGEVYSRLVPAQVWADSLARDALDRARRADKDFAPTLLLLEEMALRDGDMTAALRLGQELREAGADTTHQVSRQIMLRCVRDGPAAVDWEAAFRKSEMTVLSSGKILAGRAAQPACAIASFRTIVHADSSSTNARWAAFLGLQGQLAAVNDRQAAATAFEERRLAGLPLRNAYLLVASAGAGFEKEANAAADSAATSYAQASSRALWYLASWETRRKNVSRVREIARVLEQKVDSTRSRSDLLLRRAVVAKLRLLEGDSSTALRMLRALTPTAPRDQLAWQPWESLGPERMMLAQLLFARGNLEEARLVATELDATEPVIFPLYLRESLILRARIARSMKNQRLVDEYNRRLRRLSVRTD